MQAHERFQRDTVPCLGNRRTNRELSIRFHLGIHKEVQRPDDGTASLHVSIDVVVAVGMPFAVPIEKVIGVPPAAGEEQIVPPCIIPHDARQRAIEVGIDDIPHFQAQRFVTVNCDRCGEELLRIVCAFGKKSAACPPRTSMTAIFCPALTSILLPMDVGIQISCAIAAASRNS